MFNLLYKSLVRPHLEYASSVWCPSLKGDIQQMEKVQRRATKLLPSLADLSYNDRLQQLQLPTLQYRRLRTDLIFLYKVTHDLITLNTDTHCSSCTNSSMLAPSLGINTRGHDYKFQIQHHQGIRNHFLSTRCVPIWNKLNHKTVNAISLNQFKNYLSADTSMPNKFQF